MCTQILTNGLVAQEWNDDNVCNNSTFMLSLKSPNYSYTIHNDLIHSDRYIPITCWLNSRVAATKMFFKWLCLSNASGAMLKVDSKYTITFALKIDVYAWPHPDASHSWQSMKENLWCYGWLFRYVMRKNFALKNCQKVLFLKGSFVFTVYSMWTITFCTFICLKVVSAQMRK